MAISNNFPNTRPVPQLEIMSRVCVRVPSWCGGAIIQYLQVQWDVKSDRRWMCLHCALPGPPDAARGTSPRAQCITHDPEPILLRYMAHQHVQ